MMTREEMEAIVRGLSYKNWRFITGPMDKGIYLQVELPAIDQDTHWPAMIAGRKWYISPHAGESEIVRSALAAVIAAEEHEAREHFRYKGQRLFGPHLNVDHLLEVSARPDALQKRIPPKVST